MIKFFHSIYFLFFSLILNILFLNSLSAQSNFKSGKIITLTGDTIYGMIDDQNKLTNPNIIYFKENNLKETFYYKPFQIKASIIDSGDFYLSAIIDIDMNYGKSLNMSETYSKDTIIKKDTVFIRVLLQSKMSLYLYNDENNKNHFYYTNDSGSYHELTFKKVPVVIDDKRYLKNSTRYKNQLKYLMSNCPEAESKINKTEYKENDLLELFGIYNKCLPGNQISFKSLLIPKQNSFYLIVGLDLAQLVFKGKSSFGLENGIFSKSYNPSIGLGINIPFTRSRNKFSVFSELAWKQFDTRADYYNFNYYENNIHFQLSYLKLNSAFKYLYPNKAFNTYLFFGPSINYLIHLINTRHEYNHNPNLLSNYSREKDDAIDLNEIKLGIGLFGGVGIKIRRISFEIRYERYKNFRNSGSLLSYLETSSLLIKYNLEK